MSTIQMPAKELVVKDTYDVIVLGGGTAGTFAGISAARSGLRVLIVEQFGMLGGSATAGLVTPLMPSHLPDGRSGHCSLSKEVTSRMNQLGNYTEAGGYSFDTNMLKFVLEEMVTESHCDLLYYTTLVDVQQNGGTLSHVIVHNKDGLCAYAAAYFIDGTGDADLALLAGVPCNSGNQEGVNQPVSLRFEMDGIDFDAFHAFMKSFGNGAHKYFARNTQGMQELLKKGEADGLLTAQDICYFQAFGLPGRENAMNFNCPELTTKANVVDTAFMTKKQVEGKQAILRLAHFLQKRVAGFENAYITDVAVLVGFRESRRIEADYVLTIHDVLSDRKFDDAVVASRYPVDVHGVEDVTLGLAYEDTLPPNERFWEVPYRCMLAKNTENLLVAGRCAGFDFRAQSATRIQLICRAMGEAAGLACAIASKNGTSLRQIDGKELCERMGAKEY